MKKGEAQNTAAQNKIMAALKTEANAAHARFEAQVVRSDAASKPTGKKAAK